MDRMPDSVTGGVDTHRDVHVAAALDHLGRVLGTGSFPANRAGYRQLLVWLGSFGTIVRVGVEGTGSWAGGLSRYLQAAGIGVMIGTQAILIMGGVTRLLPLTGVTLPFVSYGGTSMIFSAIAIGVLLNVSSYTDLYPRMTKPEHIRSVDPLTSTAR